MISDNRNENKSIIYTGFNFVKPFIASTKCRRSIPDIYIKSFYMNSQSVAVSYARA